MEINLTNTRNTLTYLQRLASSLLPWPGDSHRRTTRPPNSVQQAAGPRRPCWWGTYAKMGDLKPLCLNWYNDSNKPRNHSWQHNQGLLRQENSLYERHQNLGACEWLSQEIPFQTKGIFLEVRYPAQAWLEPRVAAKEVKSALLPFAEGIKKDNSLSFVQYSDEGKETLENNHDELAQASRLSRFKSTKNISQDHLY